MGCFKKKPFILILPLVIGILTVGVGTRAKPIFLEDSFRFETKQVLNEGFDVKVVLATRSIVRGESALNIDDLDGDDFAVTLAPTLSFILFSEIETSENPAQFNLHHFDAVAHTRGPPPA
ncbi:MAG: hypothetical protein KDD33_02435 [Bdellovibrionales bacterium]|nr:hypothetical protein [Bdellovibrionales bacterium]